MAKKFRLYDIYDGKDRLIETDSIKAVAKECRDYAEECEDECIFLLYQYSEDVGKYQRVDNWHYNKCTVTFD